MAVHDDRRQQRVHVHNALGRFLRGKFRRRGIKDGHTETLEAHETGHQTSPDRRLDGGQLLAQALIDFLSARWIHQHKIEIGC